MNMLSMDARVLEASEAPNPPVTIVIPFYNDPYVGDAIESALSQSYQPLEIIVVNDGSERETERLAPYNGLIRVINQPNGGTANALNAGFKSATGFYIAWLSSDDRFHKDKIAQQVNYMQEAGYSISHTAFWRMDPEGTVERQPIVLQARSLTEFYQSLLISNTVNGCTVMMTRSFYARMGGFNERLPYTHDYELWIRAVLSGFPIGYMSVPLTEYRVHPGMGTMTHRKEIAKEIDSIQRNYTTRLYQLLTALQGDQTGDKMHRRDYEPQ
jgi:teichuronic acid biosynthesis glycosyltransferase TuaG